MPPKKADIELHVPTASRGAQDKTTRRFNQSLAAVAREMVPPELIIEFHLAVLQNHNPRLVRDDRLKCGWRVTWDEKGELQPSLGEKTASMKSLKEFGYGLPAQSHYLEADIRASRGDVGVDSALLSGNPEIAFGLLQAVRSVLTRGDTAGSEQNAPDRILDASCEEVDSTSDLEEPSKES